jgi:hypothetical protein
MKKILNLLLGAAVVLSLTTTSCADFLNAESPSTVDADFVFSDPSTARAALYSMYNQWETTANGQVFGAGLFYACDVAGSDIERHPEKYENQLARHQPETFYANGTETGIYGIGGYDKENSSAYSNLFSVISKANSIITAIEEMDGFAELVAAGVPTTQTQMYGEAIAARATSYMELIKYYGDVPYMTKAGVEASGLAPRDSIYDGELANLVRVEPLMYKVGENADITKNYFTRTYVQGLIGRMAMHAGGYATRRTDMAGGLKWYKGGDGTELQFEQIGSENNKAVYTRRSDWKAKYELAKTYLQACATDPGTVKFYDVDPRSDGAKKYGNPFQYFFQQMHADVYADESIYEYNRTQGVASDERTYSSGRVSAGNDGGSKPYPSKAYGQARIQPTYYYGDFDPNDLRRDVTVTVSGHTGEGYEKLIPFAMGSTSNGGGLCLNKWDEARMDKVYIQRQRRAGINGPYMRISEIYLNLAEVSSELGDASTAKQYLTKIRSRAFRSAALANIDGFISKCGSLTDAILTERTFEFGGEGYRRWDLLRTGKIFDAVAKVKQRLTDMVNGLETNGYYTFENGNTISAYVWTKMVDPTAELGYRLTTEGIDDKDNPLLYPGWRGQNDDWAAVARDNGKEFTFYDKNPKSNMAIKGLFNYIDPAGDEAKALEADGYTKQNWGADIVANKDQYTTYVFYKFNEDGQKKAPIYLWPLLTNTILASDGAITNGYGFDQGS